jgi:hypothetical protein
MVGENALFHIAFKSKRFVLGIVLAALSSAALIAVRTPNWVVPLAALGFLAAGSVRWEPQDPWRTMAIVLIGWVLFQGLPMADTWVMLGRMIGIGGPAAYTAASILTPKLLIVLGASVVCASPLARIGLRKLESLTGAGGLILRGALGAAVLAACILMLTADTYNPFIYFRF